MMTFYPQIKLLHLWLVGLSGGLFAVRGLCALLDMRWPRWAWVKWTSVVIDSLLLTAAAMLVTMLPKGFFANGWLAVKLVLIAVYIVLGIASMRASLSKGRRWALYLAAVGTFAWVIGIAHMHQPWGWLASVIG